ncbi:MAG: DNA primase, partial [Planctomycetota bacterium]
KEALAILAERAGIAMVYSNEAREAAELAKQRKLHIYRAQTLAQKFFVERLAVPEGRVARDYLKERALDALAGEWGLGFAPDRWDGLTGKFATSAPKERLLVAAGLARERESGGVYDVFRSRLMFPIRDTQGRIVGFGGRLLGEGDAKYLNTPETPVFSKGKLLYGLDRAREEIGKSGAALVVEGYTDVIRCHEHGFTNAVAALGTALTADHLRLLRRMGAKRIVLVFDGDAAGTRAAEKGTELVVSEDVLNLLDDAFSEGQCVVAMLDGDLDPCDLLAKDGADCFRRSIESAVDIFDFKINQVTKSIDMASDRARVQAALQLMPLASIPKYEAQKWALRKRIADQLRVPEEMLAFTAQTHPREHGDAPGMRAAPEVSARPGSDESLDLRAERYLASLLAAFPAGVEIAEEEAWEKGWVEALQDPVAQEVIAAVAAAGKAGENTDARALLNRLNPQAVEFAVDAMEETDGVPEERMVGRIRKAAIALWLRRAKKRLDELIAEAKTADRDGDEDRQRELLRDRFSLEGAISERKLRSDPDARRRAAARKG